MRICAIAQLRKYANDIREIGNGESNFFDGTSKKLKGWKVYPAPWNWCGVKKFRVRKWSKNAGFLPPQEWPRNEFGVNSKGMRLSRFYFVKTHNDEEKMRLSRFYLVKVHNDEEKMRLSRFYFVKTHNDEEKIRLPHFIW